MSNIYEYYGGSVLALKGKECVLIVSDQRLGNGSITASTNFQRIQQITPTCYTSMPFFLPDCQKLVSLIQKNQNLFKFSESRLMSAREISNMVSYILYENRFKSYFTHPVIAGLDNKIPYISGMDSLGSMNEGDFVASGTAFSNLIGGCENVYSPDLSPEELFTIGTQIFISALDRDALSGWGAEAVLITKEKVYKRKVKGRMD